MEKQLDEKNKKHRTWLGDGDQLLSQVGLCPQAEPLQVALVLENHAIVLRAI